ncbi:hypothetical protein K466DRAFT_606979 [Polyporus arcularius HHB13444]|uniref:Uncharacterized protein n=1 Tax=Polyporus arcularius HHB13444 TaxID=1314778 RepID=A0A5C3NYB9_9APHY|nr:hypothetical protein K466DRAFT_606979 [Polyporus arcularius HHB13444]
MSEATHQALLEDIRMCEHEVLQYDATQRVLATWLWPAKSDGDPVPPNELRLSRVTHDFLGPCCLCPRFFRDMGTFVESSILIAPCGAFSGEYVASCAQGRCGYVALLDRVFPNHDLEMIRVFARKDDEARPRPVYHHSEDIDNAFNGEDTDDESEPGSDDRLQAGHRGLKRRHDEAFESDSACTEGPRTKKLLVQRTCSDIELPQLSKVAPGGRPLCRPITYTRSLKKLDSRLSPGVTKAEFKQVFVECQECESITTRRAFVNHECGVTAAK